jgi:hypothetical protein
VCTLSCPLTALFVLISVFLQRRPCSGLLKKEAAKKAVFEKPMSVHEIFSDHISTDLVVLLPYNIHPVKEKFR